MNKVNFSDINKFITSIGLLLIVLGLLLPWYVTSYNDVLTISNANLESLTESARNTITSEQSYINWLFLHLKCLMLVTILSGISLMLFGLWRWNKRQIVLNGIQDEDWRLKKQQGISVDEKKHMIENELDQQDITENVQEVANSEIISKNKKSLVRKYMEIEDLIYFKLAQNYSVNYRPKQNIRINSNSYDIILESKDSKKRSDLLIEVKYYGVRMSYSHGIQILQKFMLAVNEYEQSMQKSGIIPVLIFVYKDHSVLESNSQLSSRMLEFASKNNIENFRFIEITDEEIESIKPEKLLVR